MVFIKYFVYVWSVETVEEREEVPPTTSATFPPTPEKTSRTKEEFTAIISMSDGIVKHTSTGIVDVLGFPVDMWVGRSITDFVQAKDRAAFASHITSGVASPLTQVDKGRFNFHHHIFKYFLLKNIY